MTIDPATRAPATEETAAAPLRARSRGRANWDRSLRWRPARVAAPHSEAALREVVLAASAEGRSVRVVGARHSWSEAAVSPDVEVSLDRMARVLDVDPVNLRVTAEAGIRLHRLIPVLARHGLALENVGSITAQSLGGAVATGTHGTGQALGNLATQVEALRLVTADGEVQELTRERDGERFRLAVLSFGALGIVSGLTIRVVRAHRLRLHAYPLAFDAALEELPSLLERFPRVKLWWFPLTDLVWVHTWEPTEDPVPRGMAAALGRLEDRVEQGPLLLALFYGALRVGDALPAWVPTINRLIASNYFKDRVRIAPSEEALTIAMPPRHLETEYGVPIGETAAVLRALRDGIRAENLPVSFVQEIRFVEADDLPLSPCYQRRSAMITCCSRANVPGRAAFFSLARRVFLARGGRVHWGKRFADDEDASTLRAAYPALDALAALRRELDPRGRFRSPFVDRVLGLPAPSTARVPPHA